MEPVNLDLTGPSCGCPLAFDGDLGAPCAFPEDLSVPGIDAPASLLPPPVGPTSAEQVRRQLGSAQHSSFVVSAQCGAW